jgi:hypothetical protein
MLKRQKMIALIFCCALVFGAFTATAGAQELAGTTYRLFMYTFDGTGINTDLIFDGSNLILTAIGSGIGSFFPFPPAFVGTYRALGATVGELTGDVSMYLAGTTLSEGASMLGLGFAMVKGVADPIPFWFTGKLLVTAE